MDEPGDGANNMAKRSTYVTPLDGHLGYWLRYVSNHVSHAFGQKIAARGVTVAEWVVLRELYDCKALAPSVLADRLGMTRGAISKLADRLLAKSLLSLRANDEDRRSQFLSLTESGRALVPELATLADQNDTEFFRHLASSDREAVVRIMKEIVARLALKTIPTS